MEYFKALALLAMPTPKIISSKVFLLEIDPKIPEEHLFWKCVEN